MFTRCNVLSGNKLCQYEGTRFFSKNNKAVCMLHKKMIVSGIKVRWASKRLLEWDEQRRLHDAIMAAIISSENEEYYSKENS